MIQTTRFAIPKMYEVYYSNGTWYGDLVTDVSRINIYTGPDERLAVLAVIRDDPYRPESIDMEGYGTGIDCDGIAYRHTKTHNRLT